MNELPRNIIEDFKLLDQEKFVDPDITGKGEKRASVSFKKLETLWINTGTLCNITCANCYIESSPTNDSLSYFSLQDAVSLFDEISSLNLETQEIGFTGGEPFMNPDMLPMLEEALNRGFDALVLTNAMQPMMRPKIKEKLLALNEKFPGKLTLRVSLDHYSKELHELERGPRSWEFAIRGLDWLSQNGFSIAIAGRTCWQESEASERAGYAKLLNDRNWPIDPENHGQLILFPEMNAKEDVPEITVDCWNILNVEPQELMCATSRMVVKRKGDETPTVMPCTLLPYDQEFGMGANLKGMLKADGGNFKDGAVKLNHPHCSKFCVLGGGSCSG